MKDWVAESLPVFPPIDDTPPMDMPVDPPFLPFLPMDIPMDPVVPAPPTLSSPEPDLVMGRYKCTRMRKQSVSSGGEV